MTIKNIILDIGDVICEWNPEKLLTGIFADATERRQAYGNTIGHGDWLDLDRGTIALEAAILNAQRRSSLDPEKIEQVYSDTPRSLAPMESSVLAIKEARAAGIPLYVLSNMQHHAWKYLSSTFDFWSNFTGIVVSCEVGLIKPEPAIYQHLLTTYGLTASETIFIDDMDVNIAAAKQEGLQGYVLRDRDKGGDYIRSLF